MVIMQYIILMLIAYLLGSIPTGKILGFWLKGIDIQSHGSGNIGFANACRVLGMKIGVLVLIGDISKSFLPLLVAKVYLGVDQYVLMTMGVAAVLGHAYPVWLRFRGGKSIATGFGAMIVINPLVACFGLSVYCVTFMLSRKSAISSLVGAWSLVLVASYTDTALVLYCLCLALFALYTHRTNIQQMIPQYVD